MAENLSRNPKLDALDYRILLELQKDARITKTELGEKVGLSSTRCWERMRRMEKAGIIRGYHADVDLSRLANYSFFLVQIRVHDYSPPRAKLLEKMLDAAEEVVSSQSVLGQVDYFLIVAAKSIEHYQELIEDLAQRGPVTFDYTTFPISRVHKPSSFHGLLAMLLAP